ncbi:putative fibroblast growth factor 1 [Denticeps clupeoides]|uniref:putative fibroblast growth factor 1 n=1 Tax=Denticeps clupeoides TaxID=299321 RepID=UPI0010A366C4|nr:putative fibroblast growth factor 1 [Denticeps clupeoides]
MVVRPSPHLQILPDGVVGGTRGDGDPHSVLRIKAVRTGLVVIEGIQSGLYLCMDAAGKLYGSPAVLDECYFLEKLEENHYNTYMSQKYKWYVGLKKNGRPKDGTKTHIGQKGIFFLPREVADH